MKRISAYQATDGKLFDDKKACRDYQKGLNVLGGLAAICSENFADTSLGETIQKFLLDNAEAIQAALKGQDIQEVINLMNERREDGQ